MSPRRRSIRPAKCVLVCIICSGNLLLADATLRRRLRYVGVFSVSTDVTIHNFLGRSDAWWVLRVRSYGMCGSY
ncbi:hypothetical protein HSEST_1990 [Halapricum desulfuricans]|uniref:Uncharacterized protein n=1 Tax=Halapricum desulfuricans TaxID=2841257 RepID=A0A897NY25_9EURY|nr:hypothetical protein HSEST_1990 [Halapricum desulfuricans]